VVSSHKLRVRTSGQADAHDITGLVTRAVSAAGVEAGIVTIFVVGSTAAVTTIEF
jgi:thiamine phosphate synthase YjbQ (UPF0047 family)